MGNQTTIVEINGVKLEVDMRNAKRIDTLRVGSRVKVLIKEYSGFKTCGGVVVGFEPFASLPSIVVAYMDVDYSSANLRFKTFNAETKDFEIVADLDQNSLEVDKTDILRKIDAEIAKKQAELEELDQRKTFFIEKFAQFFKEEQQ